MTEPSERDARFWALSAEAKRIGALPDPGRPEVERLAAIFEEMQAIVDDLPEERLRRFRDRLHRGRGRAVDIPPSRDALRRYLDPDPRTQQARDGAAVMDSDETLAARYFDEVHAPGLRRDGLPQDGVDHLRRRYIVPSGRGTACQSCDRHPLAEHTDHLHVVVGKPRPITPPYRRETTLSSAAGEAAQ
jgi:hypothetical protein